MSNNPASNRHPAMQVDPLAGLRMTPPRADASVEEKIEFIAQHILDKEAMHDAMKDAVSAGIKSVVSDPEFWSAAGTAMQQRAQSTAGGWLFAGFRAMFSRIGFIVMLLIGMGMVGGWPGFVAGVKAIVGSGAP